MKIAVVGAGVAGLAAARALAGRADVAVFEAAPAPGGHVCTVELPGRRGAVAVDLGFIVHNRESYPHLTRLFAELGIATRPTSMAFSVDLPARDLVWGSETLDAVFADRRRVVDPRHWRFVARVLRFVARGARDLASGCARDASLAEYLARQGVAAEVRDGFVVPLAAALWSLAPDHCGAFPAETFLRFLDQHGMLRPVRPLAWRTIVGGSRRYVDALVAALPARLHRACPVERVERDAGGATVVAAGRSHRFDRVVLACHADTALELLAAPTAAERAVLGAFRYSPNHVVLHQDRSFLPRRRAAWASWNYVGDPDTSRVAMTYWMNRLAGLPDDELYLVTLNPRRAVARVLHETWMDHPQLDAAALAAQAALPRLQGTQRTYYAGAHAGFGFHEDGYRAGLAAAARVVLDASGQREYNRAAPRLGLGGRHA